MATVGVRSLSYHRTLLNSFQYAQRTPPSAFARLNQSRTYSSGTPYLNLGLKIVPQQKAYVIERFGKFRKILPPGLHVLVPLVDRVAYIHSLKEEAMEIQKQTAITRDNVTIFMDGVLYVKIVDPYKASYGIEHPFFAITQLAQTTMRSELGKITLDMTFKERDKLNENIVAAINQASTQWGIECLRYEIRDIQPPSTVRQAMDKQAEAERQKRAMILESEGEQQAQINMSEGRKQGTVLASEAAKLDQINRAEGDAEAILARATATAKGIDILAKAILQPGGRDAVALRLAEQYITAFSGLARKGSTVVLPANVGSTSAMVTEAMSIFSALTMASKQADTLAPPGSPSDGSPSSSHRISSDESRDLMDSTSHDASDDASKEHHHASTHASSGQSESSSSRDAGSRDVSSTTFTDKLMAGALPLANHGQGNTGEMYVERYIRPKLNA